MPISRLDPSVGLAIMVLRRTRTRAASDILGRYAPGGRVEAARVPGFVAALAHELGAGIRRTGRRVTDFAIVSPNHRYRTGAGDADGG